MPEKSNGYQIQGTRVKLDTGEETNNQSPKDEKQVKRKRKTEEEANSFKL